MKYTSLLALSLLALAACAPEKKMEMATDYVQYVNPMIGTDFTGNTYPGAQAPYGMVQLSPDNGLPGWDRYRVISIRIQPLPVLVIHICQEQERVICMISYLCR